MDQLMHILTNQAKRYPLLQPTDAVKLIYQNEFGGGHLIRDEKACLEYLKREYDAVAKRPGTERYEQIGNGILRVNLAALNEPDLQWLGDAFLRSAAAHRGNLSDFLEKLEILRKATATGIFSFDSNQLENYLAGYAAAGYPPVSHSETYRNAYFPAYRIVCQSFLQNG